MIEERNEVLLADPQMCLFQQKAGGFDPNQEPGKEEGEGEQ